MISIIVAVAKNRVIGNKGELPWNLSADLKRFAQITKGHTVIMGRKTYESIVRRLGHALPGRRNIIITGQTGYSAPGCEVLRSPEEAIRQFSNSDEEVFVIGGGEIYRQFLPLADKLYLTEVSVSPEGDAWFPLCPKEEWGLESSEEHQADDRNSHDYAFLTFVRK
jgi:dihydrofolate reductase